MTLYVLAIILPGPCYLMSSSTVSLLYTTAMTMPLFSLEDVFMTGLVAGGAGVTPENIPHYLTDQYQRMGSSSVREWVALHTVNTSTMYKLWNIAME